jgi:hypothetical protein
MSVQNKASRVKVRLFVKTVPYLKEMGKETICMLAVRFNISSTKLQKLVDASIKQYQNE